MAGGWKRAGARGEGKGVPGACWRAQGWARAAESVPGACCEIRAAGRAMMHLVLSPLRFHGALSRRLQGLVEEPLRAGPAVLAQHTEDAL